MVPENAGGPVGAVVVGDVDGIEAGELGDGRCVAEAGVDWPGAGALVTAGAAFGSPVELPSWVPDEPPSCVPEEGWLLGTRDGAGVPEALGEDMACWVP